MASNGFQWFSMILIVLVCLHCFRAGRGAPNQIQGAKREIKDNKDNVNVHKNSRLGVGVIRVIRFMIATRCPFWDTAQRTTVNGGRMRAGRRAHSGAISQQQIN